MFRRVGNLSRENTLKGGDKGSEAHKKSGKIVKALNKDAEENNRNDVREETLRDIYEGKKKGLWDNIHAKSVSVVRNLPALVTRTILRL